MRPSSFLILVVPFLLAMRVNVSAFCVRTTTTTTTATKVGMERKIIIGSALRSASTELFLEDTEAMVEDAYQANSSASTTDDEGDTDDDLSKVDSMEIKRRLLDLVPRMMGTDKDYRKVEAYVNILEDRFTPVQTLQFFNLATAGEWQLLFSTNLSGMPRPNFRLRELVQTIQTSSLNGTISNTANWDLSTKDDGIFDASGIFIVKCKYSINQGARMVVDLDDHVLELARGSAVPNDVQGLVGLLHRAIPKELFDPNEHAMDTTYLDGDLRIVRMTGPRLEGVRDIFIRRGSMDIRPF